MSIPGFSATTTLGESPAVVEVQIPARGEWRFECPSRLVMTVTVTAGVAEVFGTELPQNVGVRFSGCSYAVYAPLAGGCTVNYVVAANKDEIYVSGEAPTVAAYVSDDSPARQYTNLHFALEVARQQALANSAHRGPRVLVVGSSQSGKTALIKTLAAYAVKLDRVPLLVNLDPKEGVFSVPGLLTATPISDALDVESAGGWGGLVTSGAGAHNPKQPLVKSYGFDSVSQNVDLYKHQVAQLGVAALRRADIDDQVRVGGLLVDTPASVTTDPTVIQAFVADFDINVVVVTGHDRLAAALEVQFAHKISRGALEVVKLTHNSAVAEVTDASTRKLQEDTIREYFNGNHRTRLSPYKTDVDMHNYTIYKAVTLSEYTSQMAFLPAGDSYTAEEGADTEVRREESTLDKFLVRLDDPSSLNLENSVLAITHAPVPANGKIAARDLLNASVMGYAHVLKVDDTKHRMSLLLPFPGQIPRNVLIATSIGYTE